MSNLPKLPGKFAFIGVGVGDEDEEAANDRGRALGKCWQVDGRN
jgi:hypothetical protein